MLISTACLSKLARRKKKRRVEAQFPDFTRQDAMLKGSIQGLGLFDNQTALDARFYLLLGVYLATHQCHDDK